MIKKNLQSNYIGFSMLILMIGNGISWTGLGYQLSKLFSEPRFYALIQLCSIVCSLVAPFFCIHIMRKIYLLSHLAYLSFFSCICYLGIYLIWTTNYILPNFALIFLIVSLGSLSMLSSSIESILLEPAYAKSLEYNQNKDIDFGIEFAKLASFGIFGKLIGMSLGPILFENISSISLLINSLTFLIASLLLFKGFKNVSSDNLKVEEENFINIVKNFGILNHITQKPFIETVLVNSSIFIVVLGFSTHLAELNASGLEFSLFWFGATGCSLISHWTLSRYKNINEFLQKIENHYGYIICLPIVAGLLVRNTSVIIVSQWVVSLINPITSNVSRSRFYSLFGKNEKTTHIYAIRSLISNFIILVFSLTLLILNWNKAQIVATVFLFIFFLYRWFIGHLIENQSDEYAKL